jgi:lipoic acid synthetase
VKTGHPGALDASEPKRIAEAVLELGVAYAVITSVTRDDLSDSGAGHFAEVVRAVKLLNPRTRVEVLTPDFQRDMDGGIRTVIESETDVFGHNMEVVRAYHGLVKKPPSDYEVSLKFLRKIKEISHKMIVKTGLIVGVGESEAGVFETIDDVARAGVDILSIGQYLPPSAEHHKLNRYVEPVEFEAYKKHGESRGLSVVESGPYVRSSYRAATSYERAVTAEDDE